MQLVHHVWFQPLLLCLFLLLPTLSYAFPITLPLERAFPQSQRVNMSELRTRDRERHRRILQSSNGIVNFHVFGNADSYKYGLYFTKVKLGSPPREFNLQIDTGSDILWVSCNACADCPRSSRLGIPLGLYNSDTSSSASLVSCSDQACALAMQSTDSGCNTQNSLCSYSVEYADGSGTSGYYVKDIMQLETIVEDSSNANSSAFVIFGCSNYQSGDLTKSDAAVDGIFGFGQHEMSIISQLSSRGVVPKIFSHCLRGDVDGGGILVLGEILEPDIVYSPLVPSQYHYNLNLQSISINGKNLPIDPAVFATSINRGTIVDSGTTLAFLVEEAYDPFVSSLIDAVSQSSHAVFSAEKQCFQLSSSVDDVFPSVTLNFEGGTPMVLRPKNYLIWIKNVGGLDTWCIGFQRLQDQTVLGDLVLKDKIIVYDLAQQRLGWADYDCSLSVNVSSTSGKNEFIKSGQRDVSSASHDVLLTFIPVAISAFLLM